jgi:amidase
VPPLGRREFLHGAAASLVAAAAGSLLPRAPARAADELARLDATAQADLVRRKQVKPVELVEAAIARIEALDPRLNAVVTPLFERARERVRDGTPGGPFPGVPYLLKDLLPLEGVRITFGSAAFEKHVARASAEVARRMEAAGLVILGVTNSPEFGLLPTTEPKLHGPTRNPWSPTRSPGGSSGGAAAAVAAGLVPLAQASDGGGSIRIPASACGLFGLKPSRGRNPEAPDPDWLGLSVRHCVSRSVRDSAILLDAIRGPSAGDRWWAPAPERPYAAEVGSEPGRLRIGFTARDFGGRPVHPDCVAAVESTAALCEELGHHVEEAAPEIDRVAFDDAFLLLWSAYAAEAVKGWARVTGRKPGPQLFEPFTWQLVEHESRHTPADVALAWSTLQDASYALVRFHEMHDLLLTPVLGEPPVEIGGLPQDVPFEAMRERLRRYVPFTPVANASGQPAMSVPLFWSAAGLPIGSHFVARYGDEATLVRLASQLERARPWAERRPALFAG